MIVYFWRQLVVLKELTNSLLRSRYSAEQGICHLIFWPNSTLDYVNYFGRAYILQDVTLYIALKGYYKKVKFVRYSTCLTLNDEDEVYYSAVPFGRKSSYQGEHLYKLIKEIPSVCYPSSSEIRFWENKVFMHREFEKHNVPCPETLVITDLEDLKKISVEFPILTKIPNGNHSRGIISHSNIKELSNYVAARRVTDEVLLLQEQMSVDFDIRVVTIGKEVVYHYWRDKQLSKEFTTTSTSNGSILRVDDLPKEIIKCVQTVSSELGLRMAAYDITYFVDNDKLTPKIFEVSPSFLLNPIPKDTATLSLPYINYKKGWRRFVIDRIEQFVILKKLYVKEVQSSRLTGMDR